MTKLSLSEAARASGTSRSTLLRRIQAGRLSAPRTDEGVYAIDPQELLRICPPRSDAERSTGRVVAQPPRSAILTSGFDVHVKTVRLEAQLEVLQAALDAERKRADEIREERDRWHAQAASLASNASTVVQQGTVDRGLTFLRWLKSEKKR